MASEIKTRETDERSNKDNKDIPKGRRPSSESKSAGSEARDYMVF